MEELKSCPTWEGKNGIIYHTLFYTELYTGMRRSELLGLSWRQVDCLYGQISVERGLHCLGNGEYVFSEPKSAKSRRTIAMPPSLPILLRELRAKQEKERKVTDDSLVFSSADGQLLRPDTVSRVWILLAKKAGIKPIPFHAGRHTHATLLLRQGTHPQTCPRAVGAQHNRHHYRYLFSCHPGLTGSGSRML